MTEHLPTADGIVEQAPDGSTTVRFDRRLRHPIERVWEALTDPDELRRWWGDTKLLEISADWGSTAPGQPGTRTHLTWELEPDGDHTLLHFTNRVDAPDQDAGTAAGWHLHLDALAVVLAGREVDIAHPDDLFAPLQQAYTEKYGAPPEPG
jgi:uncharacterized protein YndB with AHSA1/START domain